MDSRIEDIIADLTVALDTGQRKSGAPARAFITQPCLPRTPLNRRNS
ncbi:MAG: hypothetical protein M1492_06795 [Gammaproteobacteria bacterium]|nr:hypothetical protein [Gammaproteobacteria bacterium]